jgi:tRNA1(Val) A37 N6-methylase TrmN6
MSYPAVLFKYGADYNKIVTNDIREDSPAQYHKDFLTATEKDKYDIVITNPPFNIAQDIINKSLEVVKPGGYVIMLLRLNYF